MTDIEYQGFAAYREHMSKTFRVTGTVVVPHAGYHVFLERVVPQGINRDDLMLRLIFQPDFETDREQPVGLSAPWGDSEPPTYTSVHFQVQGPDTLEGVEPPAALTVTDVY